jgi:hypothetical protein
VIPGRDAAHSTPDSLAAAKEWREANGQIAALNARAAKYGPDTVTPEEMRDAYDRLATAQPQFAAAIPDRLATYRAADWPGWTPAERAEAHRKAQDAWTTAHEIDRAQFERLQQLKLAERSERKPATRKAPNARTRRTSQ